MISIPSRVRAGLILLTLGLCVFVFGVQGSSDLLSRIHIALPPLLDCMRDDCVLPAAFEPDASIDIDDLDEPNLADLSSIGSRARTFVDPWTVQRLIHESVAKCKCDVGYWILADYLDDFAEASAGISAHARVAVALYDGTQLRYLLTFDVLIGLSLDEFRGPSDNRRLIPQPGYSVRFTLEK